MSDKQCQHKTLINDESAEWLWICYDCEWGGENPPGSTRKKNPTAYRYDPSTDLYHLVEKWALKAS